MSPSVSLDLQSVLSSEAGPVLSQGGLNILSASVGLTSRPEPLSLFLLAGPFLGVPDQQILDPLQQVGSINNSPVPYYDQNHTSAHGGPTAEHQFGAHSNRVGSRWYRAEPRSEL